MRNEAKTEALPAWTPIFFPIIAFGSAIGCDASDIMANGFFWKRAAMMIVPEPLSTAGAVMSGEEIATSVLPAATTASWATVGPPETRLTEAKPFFL